ncbi:MAG TPA: DUF255 domain-containing protein [Acidiferrobacterales bacterium]|nr:DUF255 domain-containing protein [Acidiferrobacterales bacterium]
MNWLTAVLAFLVVGAASAAPLENQLHRHPSPYLALHGDDPVAWQEWNAATVERARREGKLLYLSIGYFSCHWCHVMQRDSYRNAVIARYLNEHVIPVKVDRELEPALDARLIEFSEKTRGMSGWPLNVFVTPDGHPLYATLYHPPEEFHKILVRIEQLWRGDRARLTALARIEAVAPQGPGKPEVNAAQARALAERVVDEALKGADNLQGGFGEQSKFPQSPQLAFLLARYEHMPVLSRAEGQDPRLRDFLLLTLDAMAGNGLQDQLGGGFFRYTVDPSWKTPHFEKMLYDNAQLARLYLNAARVFGREDYRHIANRTLDFMLREMRAASGAFIAALSALDDQGVEGGYYLWSAAELEQTLTPVELGVYRQHAGMIDAASFDSGYLPLRAMPAAEIAGQRKLAPVDVEKLIASAEEKLRAARAKRRLPRDTKELAAWNGLALAAFAEAAQATKDPRYRAAAQAVRDFLVNTLWDGKALARSRAHGKASGKVALEDYAYVTLGLTEWAALTGETRDVAVAKSVAGAAWKRFYGPKGFRLEENTLLVAETGQDVLSDGPMPSPSAVLSETSLRLAEKTGDKALRRQVLAALNSGSTVISANPLWYATPVAARLRAAGITP